MVNSGKHKQNLFIDFFLNEEIDGGAITGLKTHKSRVPCKKPKKTPILSVLEEGYSRVWGQN